MTGAVELDFLSHSSGLLAWYGGKEVWRRGSQVLFSAGKPGMGLLPMWAADFASLLAYAWVQRSVCGHRMDSIDFLLFEPMNLWGAEQRARGAERQRGAGSETRGLQNSCLMMREVTSRCLPVTVFCGVGADGRRRIGTTGVWRKAHEQGWDPRRGLKPPTTVAARSVR